MFQELKLQLYLKAFLYSNKTLKRQRSGVILGHFLQEGDNDLWNLQSFYPVSFSFALFLEENWKMQSKTWKLTSQFYFIFLVNQDKKLGL